MRLKASLFVFVAFIESFPQLTFAQPPPFPQYDNQNSAVTALRSGIMTNGGGTVWDFRLQDLVGAALNPGGAGWLVDDAHFAFLECYGGGMIDEVGALGIPVWSATSSARHLEWSWAGVDAFAPRPPAAPGLESGYGLWWSETLRGPAAGQTPRNAAFVGYNNDMFGPVRIPPPPAPPFAPPEIPQYTSNGGAADATNLLGAPANTRVILFGGSTNEVGNWNSLNRFHDTLLLGGMAEADMYIMYPGADAAAPKDPTGAALPGWIDDDTTFADMKAAWMWMNGALGGVDNARAIFWSSWGHGTRGLDLVGLLPIPGLIEPNEALIIPIPGPAGADEIRELHRRSAENQSTAPKIQIQANRAPGNMSMSINGIPQPSPDIIPLGDGTYQFWFPLADDDSLEAMLGSLGSTEILVDWDDVDPLEVSFFGLTSGQLANSFAVPEPGTMAILAMVLFAHLVAPARRSRDRPHSRRGPPVGLLRRGAPMRLPRPGAAITRALSPIRRARTNLTLCLRREYKRSGGQWHYDRRAIVLSAALIAVTPTLCPTIATGQVVLDVRTKWTDKSTEANVSDGLPDKQVRTLGFNQDSRQGSYYLTLEAQSAGANTKVLSVDSDRTMVQDFRPKINAELHLFTFLKGELTRMNQGDAEIEAKIVVERLGTPNVTILTVDSATDVGHWKHTQAANKKKGVDDSLFSKVNVDAGKVYRITATLKGDAGDIPVGKVAQDLVDFTDKDKDHQFNVSWALKPRAAIKNWRGAIGSNVIKAREVMVNKGTKETPNLQNLSGAGIKIGQYEPGNPIANHTDLDVEIIKGGKFDANADKEPFRDEHATVVAGIMAANNADNDLAGVAPKADIVAASVRAQTATTFPDFFNDALDALRAKGARIVNMSFGVEGAAAQPQINRTVNLQVRDNDMIVVAAAGNSGSLSEAPGTAANALRVGALDRSMVRVSQFSASLDEDGQPPHFVAPGEYISSTSVVPINGAHTGADANAPNDYDNVMFGYFRKDRGLQSSGPNNGTSFSAPQTAGTVALMLELFTDPKFAGLGGDLVKAQKAASLRAILMTSANKKGLKQKDGKAYDPKNLALKKKDVAVYDQIGAGRLDARAAIDLINNKKELKKAIEIGGGGSVPPGGESDTLDFMPSDQPGTSPLERFVTTGNSFFDTFDILPDQEFEIAIPRRLSQGQTVTLTSSWTLQSGATESDPDNNLNMALALFRDLDGDSSIAGGVGSPNPGNYLLDVMGEVEDITGVEASSLDLLAFADGGWPTAEHLAITVPSDGYYYFRMKNLSSFADEVAFAGILVPEPSTVLLLLISAGALLGRRHRPRPVCQSAAP